MKAIVDKVATLTLSKSLVLDDMYIKIPSNRVEIFIVSASFSSLVTVLFLSILSSLFWDTVTYCASLLMSSGGGGSLRHLVLVAIVTE